MDPNSFKSVEGGMPMPSPASSNELQPMQQPAEAMPMQMREAGPSLLRQGATQPPAAVPMQFVPQQPVAASGQSPSGPAVPAASAPAIADDVDLIEKEWVIRAKQIVDKTREDPFIQSKELNKIKAEYIKKRYNKEIKLSEE
jgi:hypothetical protein